MSIKAAVIISAALLLAGCAERIGDGSEASAPAESAAIGSDEANTATNNTRPVQIGFDGPRFDACAGYGEVKPLNPNGDNFLSVRSAPTIEAEEIDRLPSGTGLAMCQQVGDWIGVVYAPSDDSEAQCGTGSPVGRVMNYEGPCKSGWVDENFIALVAG